MLPKCRFAQQRFKAPMPQSRQTWNCERLHPAFYGTVPSDTLVKALTPMKPAFIITILLLVSTACFAETQTVSTTSVGASSPSVKPDRSQAAPTTQYTLPP